MTFEDAILIRDTPEALFALTQCFGRRLAWDPFPGPGVRAWCVAHNGLGMETEYVSFKPPALAAAKMTRGPWFIGRLRRVVALPAGGGRAYPRRVPLLRPGAAGVAPPFEASRFFSGLRASVT